MSDLKARIEAALRGAPADCPYEDACPGDDGCTHGSHKPDYVAMTAAVLAVFDEQEAQHADCCVDREERDALTTRVRELEQDHIALMRAQGALADAGTVPTGDVEAGIRMLTARVRELEVVLERARKQYEHSASCRLILAGGCNCDAWENRGLLHTEISRVLARRPETP